MKKVVFLDRDGVLTKEKGYVSKIEELELYDFSREAVSNIHKAGYLAIVITNQSAVAKEIFSEEALQEYNVLLMREIGVDGIYYCPHYYDPTRVKSKYNRKCNCRKPNTYLLEKAQKDFGFALEDGYFVGDRQTDMLTGMRKGLKTVLIKSYYMKETSDNMVHCDYKFDTLLEFTKALLDGILE